MLHWNSSTPRPRLSGRTGFPLAAPGRNAFAPCSVRCCWDHPFPLPSFYLAAGIGVGITSVGIIFDRLIGSMLNIIKTKRYMKKAVVMEGFGEWSSTSIG